MDFSNLYTHLRLKTAEVGLTVSDQQKVNAKILEALINYMATQKVKIDFEQAKLGELLTQLTK